MIKIGVYMLGNGSSLGSIIAEGSAIVAESVDGGIMLWYEGDIYGANMSFEDKAMQAAGRMFQHYPTVAKLFLEHDEVESAQLVQVGEIDQNCRFTVFRPPISPVDRINEMVSRHGFTVVAVVACEDKPSFAYTIGLDANFSHPEICIVGFHPDIMAKVLQDAAEMIMVGVEMHHGTTIGGIVVDYPVAFRRPPSETILPAIFTQALGFYGENVFRMVQMFMPDKNSLFPWEDGCREDVAQVQAQLMGICTTGLRQPGKSPS